MSWIKARSITGFYLVSRFRSCFGCCFFFALSRFFIAFATVVGGIETRPLEKESCTSTYQPFNDTLTFWTLRNRFCRDALILFEKITTVITFIFVGRHTKTPFGSISFSLPPQNLRQQPLDRPLLKKYLFQVQVVRQQRVHFPVAGPMLACTSHRLPHAKLGSEHP